MHILVTGATGYVGGRLIPQLLAAGHSVRVFVRDAAPRELLPGEALDFWRVEAIEPDHLLRLRAEMKVPGAATLQWEVTPDGNGSRLVQTASFVPRGLSGVLYWYALYPLHKRIFSDLAKWDIERKLEANASSRSVISCSRSSRSDSSRTASTRS